MRVHWKFQTHARFPVTFDSFPPGLICIGTPWATVYIFWATWVWCPGIGTILFILILDNGPRICLQMVDDLQCCGELAVFAHFFKKTNQLRTIEHTPHILNQRGQYLRLQLASVVATDVNTDNILVNLKRIHNSDDSQL